MEHGTGIFDTDIRPDAEFVHYLNIALYHQVLSKKYVINQARDHPPYRSLDLQVSMGTHSINRSRVMIERR